MEMSSKDVVSDATEGVAKAILDWSAEKINSFVKKLKERKLTFIQEPKTIEIAKESYRSGEAKFYKIYVKDRELLFLVQMGLTLRKLEHDEKRIQNLRDKIFRKYKVEGLHIAEFVQCGILNRYVGMLIDELESVEELGKEIEYVLKNIEKHALFVQGTSNKSEIVKKVTIIVNSHSPSVFIISGVKSAAKIVQGSMDIVKDVLKNYKFERVS